MAAESGDRHSERRSRQARSARRWYWLLLLPFAALVYPPLYSHDTPRLFGIPFFYWYQGVWLILTAAITTLVYGRTRSR